MADTEVTLPAKASVVTVADVVGMEEVQAAHPRVVAGWSRLHRPVRWVHVAEVPDIAQLLRGGELILTTGIALPEDHDALAEYIRELAEAGVSGLGIELVRRYTQMPRELVAAAEKWELPLIALEREVPFVAITEAVHARILHGQLAQLRIQEHVHRAFHALGPAASPSDVVSLMSELAHCPVVFEGPAHRPLAVAAGTVPLEALLAGWEARCRRLGEHGPGWLAAPVQPSGQPRGRVVLLVEGEPQVLHHAVLETGASMLAVGWLLAGTPAALEHAAQRTLVDDIVNGRCSSVNELHVRARSLGVTLRPHRLATLAVRSDPPFCHEQAVVQALERTRTVGVVGQLRDDLVYALVAVPSQETHAARAGAVAAELRQGYAGHPECLAVGAAFLGEDADLEDLRRSFADADEAARATLGSGDERVSTIQDIELRGLLRLLSDDPRLQRFVASQLRPLWEHDEQHGTRLIDVLTAFLSSAGNKSAAATRSHMSRASFYHSLERLADVLRRDLEVPEVRVALHVALLASQAGAGPERSSDTLRGRRRRAP